MSDACCASGCSAPAPEDPRFRRALWIALVLNAGMFFVEMAGGAHAGSVSLLADAVDFLGDAANYGISLLVLTMGMLWRARAAMAKGVTMAVYGVVILAVAGWKALQGVPPEPMTMGIIATLALGVNVAVALLLYTFRSGDANMQSVWLCSRNDAIGNLAVVAAAIGVLGTGAAWPDLVVAALMATLGLTSAATVIRQARREMRALTPAASRSHQEKWS